VTTIKEIGYLLRITRTHGILRRYFVVNGFDGALTMLGIITGFLFGSPHTDVAVMISACLGAAIALGISGISSAYISEVAERRRELTKLEEAMISDLTGSSHDTAMRQVPILIALVNGLSPLLISLLIISPLWLFKLEPTLPPIYFSIGIAMFLIFLLGVFLGRISGISWLRSGLQTMAVAITTTLLIYIFSGT